MAQPDSRLSTSESNDSQAIIRRLLALRLFILSTFVLYVVGFGLGSLAGYAVGLLVTLSAVFSFFSWQFVAGTKRPPAFLLTVQLLWDSLVILVFVWMAGRSTNPFIYYQLLIVALSASLLPERFSWFFSAIGIIAYSAMMYVDLGDHMAHMDVSFKSHLLGMWINFSGSALLITFFVSRMSSALKRQEFALRQAREENLKNEQLIGIGTLAASTVHSFGTPLSTITMVASELDALHEDEETRACTGVIKAQIQRCKATMKKLTSLTEKKSLDDQTISTTELVSEIEEYLYLVNAKPMPTISAFTANLNLNLPGGILLLHAIINLIDNAVNAAKSFVAISFVSTQHSAGIRVIIEDDGDGLHSDALSPTRNTLTHSEKGLGIGLLLVNSTIERLGGTVKYRNPTDLKPLTQITVEVPSKGAVL